MANLDFSINNEKSLAYYRIQHFILKYTAIGKSRKRNPYSATKHKPVHLQNQNLVLEATNDLWTWTFYFKVNVHYHQLIIDMY